MEAVALRLAAEGGAEEGLLAPCWLEEHNAATGLACYLSLREARCLHSHFHIAARSMIAASQALRAPCVPRAGRATGATRRAGASGRGFQRSVQPLGLRVALAPAGEKAERSQRVRD